MTAARAVRRVVLGGTIRGRFGRALMAVGLAPLVALSGLFVTTQRADLEALTRANLAAQAQIQAAAVEQVVAMASESVQVLAANPALRDPGATSEQLREQLEAYSLFDEVTLLDTDGLVIEATSYAFTGRWDANAAFRNALEGQPFMSPPLFHPEQNRLVVEHAAPVLRGDEVFAVVVGTMDMERVWRVLEQVDIGRTGYFAAFDRHGNVIAHPDKALLLRRWQGYPTGEAASDGDMLSFSTAEGQELVGHTASVSVNGWQVAALQTADEAYALAADAQAKLLLAAAIMLLVAAAVALLISRAVSSPIGSVVSAMRRVADGRYEERVDRPGLDEIDILASSFNAMAEQLEERSAALQVEMSERDRAEEKIRYQANHDPLTGLPNRMLLKDRLDVALANSRRHGEPLAVMFLDLDRFKLVNDSVGHTFGDELLLGVADRITAALREGDSAARVGGDEYVLLLPRVSGPEQASKTARRILDNLRVPWALSGREFRVTASVGIAMYPGDGEDAETLMRNADTAMYHAKEKGRDGIRRFEAAMDEHVQARVDLERDLRRGLASGQFALHYQPRVAIDSGEITGVEALLRWHSPERGTVPPAAFIPIAEETGLISDLGRWVLRTACAQAESWRRAGLVDDMPVGVNVSARQFHDTGIVEEVHDALEETGLPPHQLELEITESTAMRDVEFSVQTLTQLRRMGVRVSIDDFGTGYSSLSYLKRFPIDTVKIDRSFVQDIASDQEDAAIVSAIIALAKSLTMQTVAEGVETESQLSFLRLHECSSFQGFIFSQALPAEDFTELLAERTRSGSQSRSEALPTVRPLLAATG